MKKGIIITSVVLSLFIISLPSFAATYGKSVGTNYMVIEGTIVSIDKAKSIFVIKDKDDGKAYGLSAWGSDIANLSQGDSVRVTVPLPGHMASKIKK